MGGKGPSGSPCGRYPRGRGQGQGGWQWVAEERGHGPCPRSPVLPKVPSAGWGWGCRLPAPGLQGAQHGVQRLERGLLLQPITLPRYQPELEPLQQLGHDHLHLHLGMLGRGGKVRGESRESVNATPGSLGPQPPAQSRALTCILAQDNTPPCSHFWAANPPQPPT